MEPTKKMIFEIETVDEMNEEQQGEIVRDFMSVLQAYHNLSLHMSNWTWFRGWSGSINGHKITINEESKEL